MPDGTFRRPPLLWEQKITQMVAVSNVGAVAGGGTSEVGSDLPPGDGGPAPEPEPIQPTPTAFGTPSTPTLTGGVQSIMVTWDGLNSSGDLYPYESAVVEVHMSTTSGFTPDATTLKGELRYPGNLTITGLTAGTTYYFKLRGRDAKGNYSTASAQASGQTGLTQTNDYGTATIDSGAVSFDARAIGGITTTVGTSTPTSPKTGDIWLDTTGGSTTHKRWDGSSWVTQAWGSSSLSANCITATQVAAGAITAGAIAADAVTAAKIKADAIDGKTITGSTFRTSATAGTATAPRAGLVIDTSGLRGYDASGNQTINVNASTGAVTIGAYQPAGSYLTSTDVGSGGTTVIDGGRITTGTITGRTIQTSSSGSRIALNDTGNGFASDRIVFHPNSGSAVTLWPVSGGGKIGLSGALSLVGGGIDTDGGLTVADSAVFMQGVYDNDTGTAIDNVGINTDYRLRRKSSRQALKYDITPLSRPLADSVDVARRSTVATVDPANVLDVSVVEFSAIEDGEASDIRVLGFIAEDVESKFPIAVTHRPDGSVGGVVDTAMVAALLAVVQQQQQTITDLTARIEALEAN